MSFLVWNPKTGIYLKRTATYHWEDWSEFRAGEKIEHWHVKPSLLTSNEKEARRFSRRRDAEVWLARTWLDWEILEDG